jgi:hypothetical protein
MEGSSSKNCFIRISFHSIPFSISEENIVKDFQFSTNQKPRGQILNEGQGHQIQIRIGPSKECGQGRVCYPFKDSFNILNWQPSWM